MASALQKYLRSEYSHSVHGGVSSLLAVVSSPAHQHAPQECTAVPGPSLGTIPHTTGPSSTVHCRPPWQCGWPAWGGGGGGRASFEQGGGGGGVWTQNLVYQQWPDQIFPIVNFVFSHYGHFGLGRGGGGFGGGVPPPWFLIILKKPGEGGVPAPENKVGGGGGAGKARRSKAFFV